MRLFGGLLSMLFSALFLGCFAGVFLGMFLLPTLSEFVLEARVGFVVGLVLGFFVLPRLRFVRATARGIVGTVLAICVLMSDAILRIVIVPAMSHGAPSDTFATAIVQLAQLSYSVAGACVAVAAALAGALLGYLTLTDVVKRSANARA